MAKLVIIAFMFQQIIATWSHLSVAKSEDSVTSSPSNLEQSTTVSAISDHRFFLQEIFTKYGHDGQMTFEGFEHLLESLGLGNIIIKDHDVGAHKENAFQNIHESHEHSKKIEPHDDHQHSLSHSGSTTKVEQAEDEKTYPATPSTSSELGNTYPYTTVLPTKISEQDSGQTIQLNTSQKNQFDASPTNYTSSSNYNGSIYHYNVMKTEIPELLVNISSLIDEHRELKDSTPDMVIEQCLSPRDILETFGIDQTSNLNPVSFLHLCPAIIYELDQGHCMFRDYGHRSHKSYANADQWIYAGIAVLVISLCGLLSVAVIPIMQKWFYHTMLQFFVGLAIGSLSGDALLHLLPHAMLGGTAHDDGSMSSISGEKMAIWRGFAALCGMFFFFIAERLLGNCAAYKKEKKENEKYNSVTCTKTDIGRKLSQYRKNSYDVEINHKEVVKMLNIEDSTENDHHKHSDIQMQTSAPYRPRTEDKVSHGHGHGHEVPHNVSAVAWMVIMGDGLHNFCDGLAIGAAFTSGIEGGISTSVAVFCHELPHELGDFAMLLKTGMKVKQALLYNGLSSVLCLFGMFIGVAIGNVHSAIGWVFAATAGMFLYIALVDMLPELRSSSDDSDTSVFYQLSVQLMGICTGISIMLLIANYEQDLQNIVST